MAKKTAKPKPVEEPVVEEAVDAPKKAKIESPSVTVFYRELTPSGERKGATASKLFDNREDAEEFAAKVGGTIR